MGYGNKSLNDLRDEALKIAEEHGFKEASVGDDIALMHSELSEALEDFRDGHDLTEVWYEEKVPVFDAEGRPITIDGKQATVAIRHARMFSSGASLSPDGKTVYKPCGIPSELADVIVRVLHFAGKHKIDIEQAVREKMLYNETRPFKHGGKKL